MASPVPMHLAGATPLFRLIVALGVWKDLGRTEHGRSWQVGSSGSGQVVCNLSWRFGESQLGGIQKVAGTTAQAVYLALYDFATYARSWPSLHGDYLHPDLSLTSQTGACPTCNHTMQLLEPEGLSRRRHYWCPRCGTLKTTETIMTKDGRGGLSVADSHETTETPKLVERCRKYEKEEHNGIRGTSWEAAGIAEAINLPAERK